MTKHLGTNVWHKLGRSTVFSKSVTWILDFLQYPSTWKHLRFVMIASVLIYRGTLNGFSHICRDRVSHPIPSGIPWPCKLTVNPVSFLNKYSTLANVTYRVRWIFLGLSRQSRAMFTERSLSMLLNPNEPKRCEAKTHQWGYQHFRSERVRPD